MIDEEQIDNMSYVFFSDILEELGHKLNYDAIVNYAGNSFAEKSWDMILDSNPMLMDENGRGHKQQKNIANFLGSARIATPADLEKMKGNKGK